VCSPNHGSHVSRYSSKIISFGADNYSDPYLIVKGICESGLVHQPYDHMQYQTYESNIPFVLRYMIDRNMVGASWIHLDPGTYELVAPEQASSHCQYEINVA